MAPSVKPLSERGIKSGTVIQMYMSLSYIWVILKSCLQLFLIITIFSPGGTDGPLTTRWYAPLLNEYIVYTNVHSSTENQLFDCIALLSFAVCPVLASGDSRMTASVCPAISHAHFIGHATHLDAHFISNCAKNLKCPFLVDFRCHTLGMAWHKGPGGWKPFFCAKYSWLISCTSI